MILSAVSARDEMRELLFLFPSRGQGVTNSHSSQQTIVQCPLVSTVTVTEAPVIITPHAGIVLCTDQKLGQKMY